MATFYINMTITMLSLVVAVGSTATGLCLLQKHQDKWKNARIWKIHRLKLKERLYFSAILSTFSSVIYIPLMSIWFFAHGWQSIGEEYNFWWMIYHVIGMLSFIGFHRHTNQSLTYEVLPKNDGN